ncbi:MULTISPECIES: hypothetical protein [Methylomonas]|nr:MULTISPECIES: hypothetical protein [Methylomonas]
MLTVRSEFNAMMKPLIILAMIEVRYFAAGPKSSTTEIKIATAVLADTKRWAFN